MNEIRYICGTHTKNNMPVANSVFPAFELGLAKAFGGFTRTEGNGGFIMADGSLKLEPCMVYDVAVPDGLFARHG